MERGSAIFTNRVIAIIRMIARDRTPNLLVDLVDRLDGVDTGEINSFASD